MPFIYTSAPWGQPKSFLVSKTLNFTLQRFYPPFSVEYIQVFCLICSQKYSLRYFGIYGALSFCIRFYHLWLFDLHRFFFTYHYKWFCNIQYQFKNFFQLQGIIMSPDNNSSSWYSNVCFKFFQNNCSAARCRGIFCQFVRSENNSGVLSLDTHLQVERAFWNCHCQHVSRSVGHLTLFLQKAAHRIFLKCYRNLKGFTHQKHMKVNFSKKKKIFWEKNQKIPSKYISLAHGKI